MKREFLDLEKLQDLPAKIKKWFKSAELNIETVSLHNALDKILAEDIIAEEYLPPFTRSAVDGYAVKAEDTFGASETQPAYFTVNKKVGMGEEPNFSLSSGEAAEIATGAMLPEGADCCVKIEDTEKITSSRIEVLTDLAPGGNVIKKGDDIKQDDILLEKGNRLRAQDIGTLAGLGKTEIKTYRPPKIALFATGDEIIPPGEPKKPGEIRDINTPALGALYNKWGAEVVEGGIIPDKRKQLKAAISNNLNSDIIVISGGSSVGARDFTLDVIEEVGKPGLLLHGIAVKPGKPTILGKLSDTPVLGLPGNPASAWLVSCLIIPALIRIMQNLTLPGKKELWEKSQTAYLDSQISSARGRDEFIPVKFSQKQINGEDNEEYFHKVSPVLGKSNLITTLVESQGFIHLGRGQEGLAKDSRVWVLPLSSPLGLLSVEGEQI